MTSLLIAYGRKRGIGENVLARIARLNPVHDEGTVVRGWRPSATLWRVMLIRDVVGKGWFIKKYGRGAWDKIPSCYKRKEGKRCYVDRCAVEDNVWMVN